MAERKKLKREDYTVAWICPLEVEQIAALEMLDEEHHRLPQPENDHNVYNLGSINGHNVVVAGLHTTGNCSAATVVAQMRGTFPQLRFGLLVGIGGGVPASTDAGPIRLGHIVVSKPVGQHSGAVQYDHGKAEAGTFIRTGFLAPPPNVLLNAARESEVRRRRLSEDPLVAHFRRIDTSKRGLRNYNRPSSDQDHLYEPSYVHVDREKSCKKCGCEAGERVDRSTDDSDDENIYEEDDNWLTVHRGTIASGELVMRNGRQRDTLAQSDKILCFEMEAAGALNDFPCLVVRGISDYSDSHKNDKWHGYAAAVAAAYARELFYHMPVDEVKQCRISETDVKEMIQNTRKSARAADYTEDLRIRKWLQPANASINYVTASRLCHPGTGAWFLESAAYKKFLEAPDGRLWLRGIPGSGKTVLASTIIRELECADEGPESAVVYFFFAFNDDSKQQLEHMLRSLIFQLSNLHTFGRTHLTSCFEKFKEGYEQPSTESLVDLFDQMVCDLRSVTIVLDALDESTGTQSILRWITSRNHCKFVLTGRPESDIEEALTLWLPSDCAITLENEPVHNDIKAYVQHNLETERNLSRWKSMHNFISDTLVKKAGGMFRWVYCQLEELSGCLDKPAVRLMLQTLPLDLNHTYDRILDNIPRSRAPNAIKLLQFLAFSNRPMSLRELVDAIATDPDSGVLFDVEDRLAPPHAIVGYCSSLVRVTIQTVEYEQAGSAFVSASTYPYPSSIGPAPASDARSELHLEAGSDAGSETEYEYEPQLELAHFSVKEYLLLHRNETPYQESFRIPVANAMIASTCLTYLWTLRETHLFKLMDATHGTIRSESRTKFPLTDFAARHSLDHARVAGENQEKLFFWTRKIFVDKPFMTFWLRFYDPALGRENRPTYDEDPEPPLYYASLGGLDRSVRLLLSRGAAIDAASSFGLSALQIAAHEGNLELVEILIRCGANVNARNQLFRSITSGSYMTALEAASANGQFRTAQILLEHGSDINAGPRTLVERASFPGTALRAASAYGHLEIVQFLLDHGADVNSNRHGAKANARDSGALTAASGSGHIGVAQLLLARGADVNGRRKLETPIQAACSEGHLELVELLLVNGADLNAAGGNSGNALSNACLSGNTALVRLLLDRGVDPNAKDRLYGSALQRLCATASNINLKIVQLLLDRGVDVDARGGKFGTALCEAASQDNLKVVRMLLERGADPNLRDKRFGSALQAACGTWYGASPDLVQLLLDNGADVNARGGEYGNALCAAAVTRSTEVAQMLLAEGAYINSWGGRRGDAFRIALRIPLQDERKDMVRTLIKWGWILMIRIRPVWKRRCNMSRSQPRTGFQRRDYTSSGSVSSGGSWSIKSWVSTDSCDVRNSESESD
ncbi:hypothetical protein D6D03_05467 [Aureobasidium pullulans]|nr:hypothetical protein D6D03_05467 [Aureobasidium pullulans]